MSVNRVWAGPRGVVSMAHEAPGAAARKAGAPVPTAPAPAAAGTGPIPQMHAQQVAVHARSLQHSVQGVHVGGVSDFGRPVVLGRPGGGDELVSGRHGSVPELALQRLKLLRAEQPDEAERLAAPVRAARTSLQKIDLILSLIETGTPPAADAELRQLGAAWVPGALRQLVHIVTVLLGEGEPAGPAARRDRALFQAALLDLTGRAERLVPGFVLDAASRERIMRLDVPQAA